MAFDVARFRWVIALAGFVLCAWFPLASLLRADGLLNSPDEHAVRIFAQEFSRDADFVLDEPRQALAGGWLAPRSMRAHGDDGIAPASFLGLPFAYGVLSGFAPILLYFLTPLLLVVAGLCWFALWRRVLGDRTALFAQAFFVLSPAVLYYGARGLFPNVPFMCLLVIGAWLVQRAVLAPTWWRWVLAGGSFGLALSVRGAEAPWVVAVMGVLAFWYRRQIGFGLLLALAGFGVGLAPQMLGNYALWHALGASGYTVVEESAVWGVTFLTPFGIQLRSVAKHVLQYSIFFFPLVLLALAGVWRLRREPWFIRLLAITVPAALYLAVLYGSWDVADNGILRGASLGMSYVRYWLPVLVLASVPAAVAVERLGKRVGLVVAAVVLSFGFWQVTFAAPDSLVPVLRGLQRYAVVKQEVLRIVPRNGIVVTDTTDKIFFPERAVLAGMRTPGALPVIARLAAEYPVFYFGVTLPPEHIEDLNFRCRVHGCTFMLYSRFGEESLYTVRYAPVQ